jgi:hypothetical protein
MTTKTPSAAEALEAMRTVKRGPNVRSPIYQWLADQHDELALGFRKIPPSWTTLAKFLADHGITNADGRPPTPVAVRTSWLRVEAEFQRKRTRRGRMQPMADEPRSRVMATGSSVPRAGDGGDDDAPDFSESLRG